jgi:hypothetical protein
VSEPGQPQPGGRQIAQLALPALGVLAAIGLSLLGSLAAPVASADPWVPGSGPLHPIRHYAADITHPIWAVTYPLRAMAP